MSLSVLSARAHEDAVETKGGHSPKRAKRTKARECLWFLIRLCPVAAPEVVESGPFARIAQAIRKLVAEFAGERDVRSLASTNRTWRRIALEYPEWTAFTSIPQTVSALEDPTRAAHVKKVSARCTVADPVTIRWPAGVRSAELHLGPAVQGRYVIDLCHLLPPTLQSLHVDIEVSDDYQAGHCVTEQLNAIRRQQLVDLSLVVYGSVAWDAMATCHAISALRGLPRLKRLRLISPPLSIAFNELLLELDAPKLEHVSTNNNVASQGIFASVPLPQIKSLSGVAPEFWCEFARVYPNCSEIAGIAFSLDDTDVKELEQTRAHPLFERMQTLAWCMRYRDGSAWLELLRVLPALSLPECTIRLQDASTPIGGKVVNVLLKNHWRRTPLRIGLMLSRLGPLDMRACIEALLSTPSSVPGRKWQLDLFRDRTVFTWLVPEIVSKLPAQPVCLGHDVMCADERESI